MPASAGTQSNGSRAAAPRYFLDIAIPLAKSAVCHYGMRHDLKLVGSKLKEEKSGDDIRRSATVLRSLASLALGSVRGACSGWWLCYLCRSARTTKSQRRSHLPQID